jgi:outer membrane protein, multidrug efflux system
MSLASRLAPTCLALALSGCIVGPNYPGPPAPSGHLAGTFRRATDSMSPAPPPARWWLTLNDPELSHLIDVTLASNPSLDAAQARVRQARASLSEQRADRLPTTGASAALLRLREPSVLGNVGSGGSLNFYSIGLDATWEIDLFGARARAAQGAAAAFEGAQASLADVLVSLTAEVAQGYIELRDAQQRLALTRNDIEIESRVLELMKVRRDGGTASELDVARIENQLDTTRASLAPLRASVTQQLNRLAILTDRPPGALDDELSTPASVPPPPAAVAVGDPAALLRRRPDVVVAERKLAQQTAAVGQSVAALFPKVSLLGDIGFAATSPGSLLSGSSYTSVIAPILQWTPFDFGRNRARIAQARGARDEAEADYRRTVLDALEDAESALTLYGEQRQTVNDLARARDSAEHVYALTEVRLRGGTAATIDVLDADSRRVQAEMSYQQALAQLTHYYVGLQKSLGLGWTDPRS